MLESLPVPEPQAQEPVIETAEGPGDSPAVEAGSGTTPKAADPIETSPEVSPEPRDVPDRAPESPPQVEVLIVAESEQAAEAPAQLQGCC